MDKICTSIEQSKKLIELGLDVKTADMFWDTLLAKKPEAQVNNHYLIDEYDDEHRVPAWSLSALLGMIPKNYLIEANKKTTRTLYNITSISGEVTHYHQDLVDAAVEMLLKLYNKNKR